MLTGPTCSISADEQMRTLVDHLNSNCKEAWSGRVWLDIEGTQYWTGDTNANRVWYQVSSTVHSMFFSECISQHRTTTFPRSHSLTS